MSFPHLILESADPRERGRQHGEALREAVHESVEIYRETFAHYTSRSWEQACDHALGYQEPIAAYDPAIALEIEGVAEGAGLSYADVLALNARTEIMFGLGIGGAAECTAFFAGPGATADGDSLLAQNWDWRGRCAATAVVLEVSRPDGPRYLTLTEAGLIAKIGFNSRGIGHVVNLLVCDRDRGERGVPFHVVMRALLDATTLEQGLAAIVRARRGASANYLIADSQGRALNIEAAAGGAEGIALSHPADGLLAHTNHFTQPLALVDTGVQSHPDSPARLARVRQLLGPGRGTLAEHSAWEILSDHDGLPHSICCHPDPDAHPVERGCTVASWIANLTQRSVLIAHGTPCAVTFEELRLPPDTEAVPA